MIGVLLTSTCFHEGIDKNTHSERVNDLISCIFSLQNHINQPFELIIADNSPPDLVPTEHILKLNPQIFIIRSTQNPGKQIGEAVSIRDGLHLSFSRGHKWLLKLTGRYFVEGDWSIEESINELERRQKFLYIHLIGRPMRDMPWAEGHPFYAQNLNNEKILIHAATQAFIVNPEYLINKKVFRKDYFYKESRWVNFEQKFWYAIKELDWLFWPKLPINGYLGNRNLDYSIQEMLTEMNNPIFQTIKSHKDYKDIPAIDISSLIDNI